MRYGALLPAEPVFNENRWRFDVMDELHSDDFFWACAIRDAHVLQRTTHNQMRDPVLRRLLRLGLFDWYAPNDQLNQATQAIRYSSAVNFRLLSRILELEAKVRASLRSLDEHN